MLTRVVTPADLRSMDAKELGAACWLLIESWHGGIPRHRLGHAGQQDHHGMQLIAPHALNELGRLARVCPEDGILLSRVVQSLGGSFDSGALEFPRWTAERARLQQISQARSAAASAAVKARAADPPPPRRANAPANAQQLHEQMLQQMPPGDSARRVGGVGGGLSLAPQRSSAPHLSDRSESAPALNAPVLVRDPGRGAQESAQGRKIHSFERSAGALSAEPVGVPRVPVDPAGSAVPGVPGVPGGPLPMRALSADIDRMRMRKMLEDARWPWAGEKHNRVPPALVARLLDCPHATPKRVQFAVDMAARLSTDNRRGINPIERIIAVMGAQEGGRGKPWEYDLWFEKRWQDLEAARRSTQHALDQIAALRSTRLAGEPAKEHGS